MKFSAGHPFADPEAAARKRDRAPLMVPSFAMAAAPAAVSEWAGHSRSNAIGSSGMRPERMGNRLSMELSVNQLSSAKPSALTLGCFRWSRPTFLNRWQVQADQACEKHDRRALEG